MMVLIVEDAELAWSYSVDGGLGVDDVGARGGLFQGAWEIFGGVADFEGDVWGLHGAGEPVEVVDGEVGFVGGGGVVAMGDVEDVVGDVFFDDEPGTTGEAHAFALANGVEPEAFVLTNATASLEFDDVAWVFTEVTTDVVVVVDFSQETDALGVFAFGIDEVLAFCDLTDLVFNVMTDGEDGLTQLPVVDLREEVGLIFDRVRTGDEPFPASLIELSLSIVARGNEVVVMTFFFMEGTKLDQTVAHDIRIGGEACAYLFHRVAGDLIPVFTMTVDDFEVTAIFMGDCCGHFEVFFRGAVPFFVVFRADFDVEAVGVEAEFVELVHDDAAVNAS